MEANLPLKVRIAVRDRFDADTSTCKVALKELNDLIGFSYRLEVDWITIREDIPETVLDNEVLVPNVTEAITIFIQKLIQLLNQDADDFADNFLEKTQSTRVISVKVHPVRGGAVTFTRFKETGELQLFLPCVRGGYAPNSSFGHDLADALVGTSFADPRASLGIPTDETHEQEYVDIGGQRTWASRIVFPEASQIPRPENLLKQTPLYLRLTEVAGKGFELDGHQPCVDLIYEYLQKHAREPGRNMDIYKRKISWGVSLTALRVEDHRRDSVCSPLVVLALIEGTLGFERMGNETNGTWMFRRNTDFSTVI